MDPQQQQQFGSMMAGFVGVIVIFGLIFLACLIFLLWRIFTKAGLAGALSLLILIPGIGSLVVLCVLAFADWKVVPVQTAAPYYPPIYPPPPPPASFQPPPPPTQV
jgi:uncharacterized membrane protein YhaH (DUF805 family)